MDAIWDGEWVGQGIGVLDGVVIVLVSFSNQTFGLDEAVSNVICKISQEVPM